MATDKQTTAPVTGGDSESQLAPTKDLQRRTLIKAAAWSVPVIAAAVSTPIAAATTADNYAIRSTFGVGWYPTRQNNTTAGALQFDAHTGKYFYVEGTKAGDVLKNIKLEFLVSDGWPELTWSAIPGSNPAWSTPQFTRTETIGGTSYRVYTAVFSGEVTATGDQTHIPLGFYFVSSSRYHNNQGARVRRFVTVNETPLELILGETFIPNTNVTNPPRP